MAFAVDPELIKTGVGVATQAWENRRSIERLVGKITRLFKEGRADIVVFGAGGVGKTRLGARLSGKAPYGKPSPNYRPDITLKTVGWPDRFGGIRILPGQVERHDVWNQQLQAVHQRKGLINVVSWGMHTPEQDSYTGHPLFRSGMSKDEFLSIYIPHCRNLEIEFMKELAPHLKALSKPFWILTLVNKQDLWWRSRLDVENHYINGEYSSFLGEVRDKAIHKFQHEIVSAAIESENWRTKSDEILGEVEPGYDARARWANISNLKLVIEELLARDA